MSTRIGYVVRSVRPHDAGLYLDDYGTANARCINGACLYTGQEIAERRLNDCEAVPVRVTEQVGPPVREVVELRGTVDLDGLKFAIMWMGTVWDSKAERWVEIDDARLADLPTVMGTFGSSLFLSSRIVGIREVPGPTVRTVHEITEADFGGGV